MTSSSPFRAGKTKTAYRTSTCPAISSHNRARNPVPSGSQPEFVYIQLPRPIFWTLRLADSINFKPAWRLWYDDTWWSWCYEYQLKTRYLKPSCAILCWPWVLSAESKEPIISFHAWLCGDGEGKCGTCLGTSGNHDKAQPAQRAAQRATWGCRCLLMFVVYSPDSSGF